MLNITDEHGAMYLLVPKMDSHILIDDINECVFVKRDVKISDTKDNTFYGISYFSYDGFKEYYKKFK